MDGTLVATKAGRRACFSKRVALPGPLQKQPAENATSVPVGAPSSTWRAPPTARSSPTTAKYGGSQTATVALGLSASRACAFSINLPELSKFSEIRGPWVETSANVASSASATALKSAKGASVQQGGWQRPLGLLTDQQEIGGDGTHRGLLPVNAAIAPAGNTSARLGLWPLFPLMKDLQGWGVHQARPRFLARLCGRPTPPSASFNSQIPEAGLINSSSSDTTTSRRQAASALPAADSWKLNQQSRAPAGPGQACLKGQEPIGPPEPRGRRPGAGRENQQAKWPEGPRPSKAQNQGRRRRTPL